MTVTPRLFVRNLSGQPLPLPADIKLSVNTYSFHAFGGPKQANLSVTGSLDSLSQAFNWLRCPLELTSQQRQNKVWWGLVTEVHVQVGQVEIVMTLDSMSNTVSVTYVKVDSAHATVGTRADTVELIDSDSIAEYGTKAQRYTLNNASAAQAAQLAANTLQLRRYPQNIGPSLGVSAQSAASATLVCRGWWDTLKWKYYPHAQDIEEAHVTTNNNHKFAHGDAPDVIAQKFSLASPTDAWVVGDVGVAIYSEVNDWKLNTSYAMYADIRADSAGAVGAVLATSDAVHPSTFQVNPDGYGHFHFSTPYKLVGGTNYWIVIYSNIGGDFYWQMRYIWRSAGSPPYARGGMATQTSGAWTYNPNDALPFRIGGLQDTAIQVLNIVNGAGQFMTGSRLDGFTGSGVITSQYRDGDRTGAAEAEELLINGTTSNLRMLPFVTPERQVVVRLEPLPTSVPAYQLDKQMMLYDVNGNRISGEYCPAGVWMALKDVLPASASFSKLSAPSPFFVEEATFDARSGRYTPAPRALGNIFKVGILP